MVYIIATQIWLPALAVVVIASAIINIMLIKRVNIKKADKKYVDAEVKRVEDKVDKTVLTMKEAQDENNKMTKLISLRVGEILEILNK